MFSKVFSILSVLLLSSTVFATAAKTTTKGATPDEAITALIEGNKRFAANKKTKHDYIKQAKATAADQHPFAAIVSCLDSRIPAEIVFDQGIGDLFVARVAGNIENRDILGSLEFASAAKGVRAIVVMGHNSCGAVIGACKNVKLGHLTGLLDEIKPAIKIAKKSRPDLKEDSNEFHDHVAHENVKKTVDDILKKSDVIRKLVADGKLKVVGAMYDLNTGLVSLVQ